MIKLIKQILNDHKAMNAIRQSPGDVQLVAVVGARTGYDCYLYQQEECVFNEDPALAILDAVNLHNREEN